MIDIVVAVGCAVPGAFPLPSRKFAVSLRLVNAPTVPAVVSRATALPAPVGVRTTLFRISEFVLSIEDPLLSKLTPLKLVR